MLSTMLGSCSLRVRSIMFTASSSLLRHRLSLPSVTKKARCFNSSAAPFENGSAFVAVPPLRVILANPNSNPKKRRTPQTATSAILISLAVAVISGMITADLYLAESFSNPPGKPLASKYLEKAQRVLESQGGSISGLPAAIPRSSGQSPGGKSGVDAGFKSQHGGTAANSGLMYLLGLGMRYVSWFRIGVYHVGIYVDHAGDTLNSHSSSLFSAVDLKSQPLLKSNAQCDLVEQYVKNCKSVAIAISPTRATQMAHLRDGLLRILLASATFSENAEGGGVENSSTAASANIADAAAAVNEFRAIFPNSKVSKGEILTIECYQDKKSDSNDRSSDASGILLVYFGDKLLGKVQNATWMKNAFLSAYLNPSNPISKQARDSCVSGYHELVGNSGK